MTKSELKKIIKVIVTEIHSVRQERLAESKKGLSGFKTTSDKKDNTQMKSDDTSITSTDKPTEKKEGKKLPEKTKNSKGNTETDHSVSSKSTPTLKETLLGMIREALSEHPALADETPTAAPDTPTSTTPTNPEPEQDEEEPQAPTKQVNSTVTVKLNGVKVAVIDFKRDSRGAEAIIGSVLYGKGKYLDYDMDERIVPKLEGFSDAYIDEVLPAGATLNIGINDKKFILGANKSAITPSVAPKQAPVQAPVQTP